MSQAQGTNGRCAPAWPKDVLRISLGVIWLIDAVLRWLPGFRSQRLALAGHRSCVPRSGRHRPSVYLSNLGAKVN